MAGRGRRGNRGNSNEPKKKGGGGGLLAGAGLGSGAGLFGLGGLLGGLNSSNDDFGGRGTSGFASSSGLASGGGGSNYTPAGAATSVLSDADSSDPVVRQLQDIEKVLVSIKGDTAILAGAGGRGGLFGLGKNNPALQSMYGRPERSDSDLKSFLPLLAAMLYGFFRKDQDGGGADFIDDNNDGVDDRKQDPSMVNTQAVLDPALEEAVLKSPRTIAGAVAGAGAAKDVLKPIVVTATKVGTGIVDAGVKGAAAASEILKSGSTMADSLPDNVIDINSARTGPNPNIPANDAINPDVRTPDIAPDIDPDAPDSMKGKVAKALMKAGAKFTPVVGDAITFADMMSKFDEGDYTGAFGEMKSLGYTYGSSLLSIPASAVGTPAAGAAVLAAGTAAAAIQDYHNATRELYKQFYGVKPEDDDPAVQEQRYDELFGHVVEYFKNLPADLMQRGPVEAQLEVESRPEVTARSGHAKRNQERAQADWDKKYGEMYNADGMMKPEFVPAAKAEAAAQGTGFIDRALNRYEGEIETAKELGEQIKEGAERLAPGLKISSDTVELSTETASRVDSEEQATRISDGVGMSVAMNQKVQSTGVIPNTPAVNVSVAGTKTSFPQGLAELKFINDRGSYLT